MNRHVVKYEQYVTLRAYHAGLRQERRRTRLDAALSFIAMAIIGYTYARITR